MADAEAPARGQEEGVAVRRRQQAAATTTPDTAAAEAACGGGALCGLPYGQGGAPAADAAAAHDSIPDHAASPAVQVEGAPQHVSLLHSAHVGQHLARRTVAGAKLDHAHVVAHAVERALAGTEGAAPRMMQQLLLWNRQLPQHCLGPLLWHVACAGSSLPGGAEEAQAEAASIGGV